MQISIDKQSDPKSTRIIFLLDRSTSMNHMCEEAAAGYNQFLKKQREADGEANISLICFDSSYEPLYEKLDVQSAPE